MKIANSEMNMQEIKLEFDSRFNIVRKRVLSALDGNMNGLKDQIQTELEDMKYDTLMEELLSQNQLLEIKIGEEMSEKVEYLDLSFIGKIKELSISSLKRETNIREKMKEIEGQTKNIMETMKNVHLQIDDIQERFYDFEINNKNNLIFYGVKITEFDKKEALVEKILIVLKMYLNIGRSLPIRKLSIIQTGTYKILTYQRSDSFRSQCSRMQTYFSDI